MSVGVAGGIVGDSEEKPDGRVLDLKESRNKK